jgi:aldehyde dehydrogenase (NAD+)
MINQAQQRRVQGYLDRARAEGLAQAGAGSIAPDVPKGGYYVPPSFFAPVPHESTLSQEEVFGPVLVATPFEDEAEAVRLANGTPYGLGRRRVDRGRHARHSRGAAHARRPGVRELLRRRRRHRDPLRGLRPLGPRAREGVRGLVEFTTTRTLVIAHG